MIIKLIQPKMILRPMDTKLKSRMAPSLALLTIANLTPEEHTIIITDENIEKINYKEKVDLVAITVTVDVSEHAYEIANKYRAAGIPVIGGGIHVSAAPEEAVENFDAICIGMAEGCWQQILHDVENGTLKKIYDSSSELTGDKIVSPKYSIINKNRYLYTNVISTSRGCTFKCEFCYNSCEHSTKYINRPIEEVLKEINELKTKHVMFVDDNFIGNPAWTREFLTAIKDMNLKWNAAVTSNILNYPDILDLMKETGCRSLFIGFESINAKSVSSVNKTQNSVEKYNLLIRAIHDRGIMINASLVFGLDFDTKDVFSKTLNWLVENRIETMTAHILTPYPGTVLYGKMLSENRITDFNSSKYNTSNVVFKPLGMTPEELREGYLWIYKKFYTFKNIFKRIPQNSNQKLAFVLFNIFYRKYGRITCILASIITFGVLGRFARKIGYRIK